MAAVSGIPRKEVLSRSFSLLRKTLSWGMTGKNVDTLNTKSCLNMIYNGLFISTLPDQSSFVGTQRFLSQVLLGYQEADDIIPYSCNDPENPSRFATFLRFTTSPRDVMSVFIICVAGNCLFRFHVCKSTIERIRFMKFACHLSRVCKELQILRDVKGLNWSD